GEADEATRLRWAGALGPFWHLRGHLTEGRAWQASLGIAPGLSRPTEAWARALTQAGILHKEQGAIDLALACLAEALGIAREVGDHETRLRTLNNVSTILAERGEHAHAARALDEALALSRQTGDRVREALTLLSQSELARARTDWPVAQSNAIRGLSIGVELN